MGVFNFGHFSDFWHILKNTKFAKTPKTKRSPSPVRTLYVLGSFFGRNPRNFWPSFCDHFSAIFVCFLRGYPRKSAMCEKVCHAQNGVARDQTPGPSVSQIRTPRFFRKFSVRIHKKKHRKKTVFLKMHKNRPFLVKISWKMTKIAKNLTIFDNFLQFLTIFVNFWQIFDQFWPKFLANFPDFARISRPAPGPFPVARRHFPDPKIPKKWVARGVGARCAHRVSHISGFRTILGPFWTNFGPILTNFGPLFPDFPNNYFPARTTRFWPPKTPQKDPQNPPKTTRNFRVAHFVQTCTFLYIFVNFLSNFGHFSVIFDTLFPISE